MNVEGRRERQKCRLFVLLIFGTMVLVFILALGLFHRSVAGNQREFPSLLHRR